MKTEERWKLSSNGFFWVIHAKPWVAIVFPCYHSKSGFTKAHAILKADGIKTSYAGTVIIQIEVWQDYFDNNMQARNECQRRLEMLEKAVKEVSI